MVKLCPKRGTISITPINYKLIFDITSSKAVFVLSFNILIKFKHRGNPILHIKLDKNNKLFESVCWLLWMLYIPLILKLKQPTKLHKHKYAKYKMHVKFSKSKELEML